MKKIISCIIFIGLLASCTTSKNENMIVKGSIDGLKKGTIYLQKFNDTLLVSVDSVHLIGVSDFILSSTINSPEIYYITLNKKTTKSIPFFGEEGEITILTKLSKFETSAKITGSKNQDLLNKHNAMIQKFNNQQLDLIKDKFDAQKNNDTALVSKIKIQENSLIRRKFLYTTNFAVLNAEYEIAPYLALTDLYYANIKLLDTIHNSLSKKVKASKYGLELTEFIQSIKENENR